MRTAALRSLAAVVLAALCAVHSLAIADLALDTRLKKLESELRCLVCQNQTLADSNADLAADLRKEVRELAMSGKTDDEIKQYLVARYGDFVLYKPPVKPTTWLLWFGPFAMLGIGAAVWWGVMRRRRQEGGGAASGPDARTASARARALLDG
ncbi:MAG: cytochrome c-type biogenesis protein [Candidatus Levyibacteriota bacterium]